MNPLLILGVVCAFLLATVVGEGFMIKGKIAEVHAAKAEIASATERATQNFNANNECRAQVEQDKASIATQNDAVEALRAKANDLERAAVQAETERATLEQTLADRNAEIEQEAKAHPESVVPLGSITRARAAQLWN